MRKVLLRSIIAAGFALPAVNSVNAQTAMVAAAPKPVASVGYPAHRVYDTKSKKIVDFETMVAKLSKADLVFLGEQHDDPRTHQLQSLLASGGVHTELLEPSTPEAMAMLWV